MPDRADRRRLPDRSTLDREAMRRVSADRGRAGLRIQTLTRMNDQLAQVDSSARAHERYAGVDTHDYTGDAAVKS